MTTQGTVLSAKSAQELNQLLKNKKAWTVLEQKRVANEYRNRKIENNEDILLGIYNLNIFSFSRSLEKDGPLSVISLVGDFYSEYSPHIKSMTNEHIQTIINRTMEGFEDAFIKLRKTFFTKNEMIQEDYDTNRLAYLVENQQEPTKVYTMEEFDYICEKVLELVRGLSLELFKHRVIKKQVAERYLNQYYSDMCKRFDTVHESIIDEMWKHFIKKMEENTLQEQDIENYQSNKICLLTNFIDSTGDFLAKVSLFQDLPDLSGSALGTPNFRAVSDEQLEMNKYVEALTSYFDIYIHHWDILKKLLTNENKQLTLSYLTSFMTGLIHLSNKFSGETSILVYNFLQKAKSFMEERINEHNGLQTVGNLLDKMDKEWDEKISQKDNSNEFDDFLIQMD